MAFDPQQFFKEHPQAVLIGAGGLGLVVLLVMQGGGQGSKKPTATPLQNTNVAGQDPGNAYVSGTMLQNALEELRRQLQGVPGDPRNINPKEINPQPPPGPAPTPGKDPNLPPPHGDQYRGELWHLHRVCDGARYAIGY